MRYLKTFETYTSSPITKAEEMQNEQENGTGTLMDKTVDKELTEEEIEELKKIDEEEQKKRKKRIAKKVA